MANDRVGEIIKREDGNWKIVADDSESVQLRKEWSYIIENVETKEKKRVFKLEVAE